MLLIFALFFNITISLDTRIHFLTFPKGMLQENLGLYWYVNVILKSAREHSIKTWRK